MNGICFDNAATTRPLGEAAEQYLNISQNIYGNPASMHKLGLEAETEIKKAAGAIAGLLNVSADELIFTSGGTESNNLAIFGAVYNRSPQGLNAVTSVTEHPSVYECFKVLEQRGVKVTYIKTDDNGRVDTDELLNAVDGRTALISVAAVCGETGAMQRVSEIGRAVKAKNSGALFHVDGVQAFGKFKIDLYGSQIDFYSFSAHKIHGLKGAGCLFVKNGRRLAPLFYGGGQQKGARPGTENAAGVSAFAVAAAEAYKTMDVSLIAARRVRAAVLKLRGGDIVVNGDAENGSPYILNMSFLGYKGEVILNALSEEGIFVSTGSACGRRGKDGAVKRMGLGEQRAQSAVRFSFSRFNTVEEAETCVEAMQKILKRIVRS